jgi:hypothetical protein
MKSIVLWLSGVVAGVALVLSCDGVRISSGSDASAAPGDCAAWQVAYFDVVVSSGPEAPVNIPTGWEPFHVTSGGTAFLRRCKP